MQGIIIYTDGSHFKHLPGGFIGYGAYCEHNGVEYRMSGRCDADCLKTYNIAPNTKISNPTAEFIGFAETLRHLSRAMGPGNTADGKVLVFRIDYEGVGRWMAGKWKTKQPYIRSIKQYCDRIIDLNNFKVVIEDVDGHSNNLGNDKADLLAKNTQTFSNFDKFVF